jgi:hypothetical protein
VRERGACRSHAAEGEKEEREAVVCVGGVEAVVAGRGRLVEGGGGGWWWKSSTVQQYSRAQAGEQQQQRAPSSEAFRSLVVGLGGAWCGLAAVQRNGRAWSSGKQGQGSRLR